MVDVGAGLEVEGTSDVAELGELDAGIFVSFEILRLMGSWYLLGEVTVAVDGTANLGDGLETINVVVLGVVGDLEGTTDGGQARHGDVGELGVGVEGDRAANSGQVGRSKASESAAPETDGGVNGSERGDGDAGDVPEGHVEGVFEVGQADGGVAAVELDVPCTSNLLELHLNLVELVVVGDGKLANGLEVDTVQRAELSIDNADTVGPLNTGGEAERRQPGESLPVEATDAAKAGEGQAGQESHVGQAEGLADGLEAAGRKGRKSDSVISDKVTSDCADTVKRDVGADASLDSDATSVGLATAESAGITLVLDGEGTRSAALGCDCVSIVCSSSLCFKALDLPAA